MAREEQQEPFSSCTSRFQHDYHLESDKPSTFRLIHQTNWAAGIDEARRYHDPRIQPPTLTE
jgi:hypothetical protein